MESAFETDTDRARSVWWETRDPKLALRQLSKKNFSTEAKIIRSLAFNGPKAYVNAFQIVRQFSFFKFYCIISYLLYYVLLL